MRSDGQGPGVCECRRDRAGAGQKLPPRRFGRGDQRSRLLAAIVEVAAEDGYPSARIATIASRARVSVSTFYEQFANKEECFLAAQAALADRLKADVAAAVAREHPADAAGAALDRLLRLAQREPADFGFLMHEAMLGGRCTADARARLIAAIGREIERAWERLPDDAPAPDLPVRVWLGGAIRLLGFHMRRGERESESLLSDLLAWVDSYAVPKAARRWTATIPYPALVNGDHELPPALLAPGQLPRGRHRLAAPLVERVQRGRIQQATAEVVRSKGFQGATVADIVASAGMSREVFYAQFHDKRDAFIAACMESFEHTLAAGTVAYFTSPGEWPDRVWAGGDACARVIVSVPSFAHLGLVESYALGPRAARRIDDALLGFTYSLQDGYRYRPQAALLPQLLPEAIGGGILETAFSCVRHDHTAELRALLPILAYATLAPFMGPQAAGRFVDRKVRELEEAAPGGGPSQAPGEALP